jgi:hypothetical protein
MYTELENDNLAEIIGLVFQAFSQHSGQLNPPQDSQHRLALSYLA